MLETINLKLDCYRSASYMEFWRTMLWLLNTPPHTLLLTDTDHIKNKILISPIFAIFVFGSI